MDPSVTGGVDPVEPLAGTGVAVSPTAPVPAKRLAPTITPSGRVDLPETLRYRLKNKLLGPPISSDRQTSERLGKPTALAVLSSDVISSSAYATEQMLIPLVIAVGVAAYSLVIPVSIAVIFVLLFVTLSYLEVVKVYTKAGGAYVVARENFGLTVAQVAAMSLLIDYTLTVAVSVAAGVAAVTSVYPGLTPDTTWIAIALVILIAYGNLRGIREAGRTFAVPTYFFIANMVILMTVGAYRAIAGTLHAHPIHGVAGSVPIGKPGSGLLLGAGAFVVLKAFASGGSALTGTEAISNGVSIFRRPESRNARITMILMAVILGSLVAGVSALAAVTHPVPYESGTPTVISQIAKFVYGGSGVGNVFYWLLQVGTTLILILAANTSFTGFPFLASFAAEDSYLPRQLTRRGHRLVFSTGIIVLTVVSVLILAVTRAKVDKLIPLYAIGVFTGFTMAGAGMAKYHLTHREDHWRRRLAINGTASVLSFIVLVIIAVAKFKEGAWVILVILPLGVLILLRLHHQYVDEEHQLEEGASEAAEAPVLNRHVVVVLVDRLDMATARALQYGRTLHPDELCAVHFTLDNRVSAELEAEWSRLGLTRLPLDVEACEDRRLTRAALELAAETVADGQTELTILLPRRGFTAGWHRVLHDATADQIAAAVGQLAHVNATVVPYQLTGGWLSRRREWRRAPAAGPRLPGRSSRAAERSAARTATREAPRTTFDRAAFGEQGRGTIPIGQAEWRHRVRVAGRVKSVRVQPRAGTSNLECVLADETGRILLVFQGRRRIPGVQPGARLVVEGMVGDWARRQAILNPDYELIAGPEAGVEPT
ncbi:MAG: amino acid permease [Acidimicrobiales bacterium]|nr:amino acid permease [Acidimicrobiales bacterium]